MKIVLVCAVLCTFYVAVIGVVCPPDDPTKPPVYFPHETECAEFYECSGGKPILFTCPTGTYWNQSLISCATGVDCGNLSTTTTTPVPTTVPSS